MEHAWGKTKLMTATEFTTFVWSEIRRVSKLIPTAIWIPVVTASVIFAIVSIILANGG